MNSIEESSKYLGIVQKLIGETISSLSNSQYFFNGEKDDEDLGELEIIVSSGSRICFKLLGDGESVGAYEGSLKVPSSFEVCAGEQASWEKQEIKQSSEIVGTKIIAINAMYDSYSKINSKVLAGWQVKLSNGDYFVFYNCGDNARLLLNELPNDAIPDIKTTWESV